MNAAAGIKSRLIWRIPEATVLRSHARRILYDIDDAMMHHNREVGLISRWRTQHNFEATTRILDHVVAGNEYLAGMFRQRGREIVDGPLRSGCRTPGCGLSSLFQPFPAWRPGAVCGPGRHPAPDRLAPNSCSYGRSA